ncbi:hypothetical protein MR829_18100 [Paracoccus versutus]|uniref:hypothetical protein n=1 Tax=Paracoccus TaxID=265 RepID=UPI001430C9F9|nr:MULTISPECIES: hypothetical protein [Paracoccus]MCJ1902276.1 hypothetical protein [Paracoccus versutus]
MASVDERRIAKAIHLSEKDGRWVYEWNTGDVGKLTIPEGFTFDPKQSEPIFGAAE